MVLGFWCSWCSFNLLDQTPQQASSQFAVNINDESVQTCTMQSLTASGTTANSIEKAAQTLKDADCLLILVGAGFLADLRLATCCETMPEERRELCDPPLLTQQLSQLQQLWIDFATKHASCQSHNGCETLDHCWCHGGTLGLTKNHGSASLLSAWWVHTSNVDGHLCRFPSFESHACKIHGFAGELQRACAMGLLEGRNRQRRQGIHLDQWNDQLDADPAVMDMSSCFMKPMRMF
jgi:hypothetical protein